MNYTRVFPIFAAAFALIYVISEQNNWALVTYHPRLGAVDWLAKPARSGPAMYWYGWIATALLGATALSAAALPLTLRWQPPIWIGWAVPLAVMIVFVYLMRGFFMR